MPDVEEKADLLHVDGQTFDPEDLSYGEKREVRRIIRVELWDDAMGEFDWEEVGENDVLPATIAVFMRRTDPDYTLEAALDLKPRDVYAEAEVPPTSSRAASARKKTSAAPGPQS